MPRRRAMSIGLCPRWAGQAFGYSLMQCIRIHSTKFCLQAYVTMCSGCCTRHIMVHWVCKSSMKGHYVFSDKFGGKFKARSLDTRLALPLPAGFLQGATVSSMSYVTRLTVVHFHTVHSVHNPDSGSLNVRRSL